MFTILLETAHGWTDNISQHDPEANRWPSIETAEAAIAELRAAGIDGHYRIIDTADLDGYELIG